MDAHQLKQLIQKGEGQTVEFKEAYMKLNRDVFETVCAFLNRFGGHLILGIGDDKKIVGISPDYKEKIRKDFTSLMNNPDKLSPTFYLSIEEFVLEDKTLLYIYVPESSQVHRCNGKIFDRNEDGDFNITDQTTQVAALYARKQHTYSENRIFPFADLEDLDQALFQKVRNLVAFQRPDHPWLQISEMDILKSAGLYLKDVTTGKEGITLAGLLLFGKEQTILSALPHYKTDAILRRKNIDRYDDRDDIRVNLIDSYERLMNFIRKHLNDSFYLEGDQRINILDKLFREIVSNLLVHREFSHPFPAKLVIEKDRVYAENSNKPHQLGTIDPYDFSPYPKNPTIAKFFKEIGRVDELGSGVRNTTKYTKIYSGATPLFIEGDIFQTIIPLTSSGEASGQVSGEASGEAKETILGYLATLTSQQVRVIKFCQIPRTRQEIQSHLAITSSRYVREQILRPMIEKQLLLMSLPEKPTSPKQTYYTHPTLAE